MSLLLDALKKAADDKKKVSQGASSESSSDADATTDAVNRAGTGSVTAGTK